MEKEINQTNLSGCLSPRVRENRGIVKWFYSREQQSREERSLCSHFWGPKCQPAAKEMLGLNNLSQLRSLSLMRLRWCCCTLHCLWLKSQSWHAWCWYQPFTDMWGLNVCIWCKNYLLDSSSIHCWHLYLPLQPFITHQAASFHLTQEPKWPSVELLPPPRPNGLLYSSLDNFHTLTDISQCVFIKTHNLWVCENVQKVPPELCVTSSVELMMRWIRHGSASGSELLSFGCWMFLWSRGPWVRSVSFHWNHRL